MTFALILAVTNRVEHYTQENRNERWAYNKDFCYWDTPLMELAGKTLGIMGLGQYRHEGSLHRPPVWHEHLCLHQQECQLIA